MLRHVVYASLLHFGVETAYQNVSRETFLSDCRVQSDMRNGVPARSCGHNPTPWRAPGRRFSPFEIDAASDAVLNSAFNRRHQSAAGFSFISLPFHSPDKEEQARLEADPMRKDKTTARKLCAGICLRAYPRSNNQGPLRVSHILVILSFSDRLGTIGTAQTELSSISL
jgi:hypothetical protein